MATTLYAGTILQDARSMLTIEEEKKFELRAVKANIVKAFLMHQSSAILNLSQLKNSNQRPTKVVYQKNKSFTINSSRSNTPSGEQSGSALDTLTWAEKNFVVKYDEKLFQNNELSAEEAFAVNMWNGEKSFWENLESNVLLAFLEANKSTVNAGDTYDGTLAGGNMTVAAGDREQFYNILESHMMLNNYDAPFQDIHNTYWNKYQKFDANQGTANQTNLAWQFDGFEFYPSNKITPAGATYASKNYIIPTGGIAMVTWNNPMNVAGKVHENGRLFRAESLFFPGVFFDVFAYESWGNTGSGGAGEITGDIQDPTINYEFTLHYSNWTQPITAAGETSIFRYDVLKNAGV